MLYVLICLEVGIFLTLIPWTQSWERNYFLQAYPYIRPILLDPTVRGAIAGLGVANIYLGLNEVIGRRHLAVRREMMNPAEHERFVLNDDVESIDGNSRPDSQPSAR